MKRKTHWSWATGTHGSKVRVFERTAGGVLSLAAWDPTLRAGKGGYRRRSLKHRDRERAKKEALKVAAALAAEEGLSINPSLGYVLDLYRYHELPAKSAPTQKWLRQHLLSWEAYLGRKFAVRDFSLRDWEGFKRARLSGEIGPTGKPVPHETRRPVAKGTVNLALEALRIALNWACAWRVEKQPPLLHQNPVLRFPYLRDLNPKRHVWTHERFESLVEAADQLAMQVEWDGKRQNVPCFLGDILVIAEETGHRIGAVRQLTYEDLRLTPTRDAPFGAIRWPADTDKSGTEWNTAITSLVRKRLHKSIRERPGLGPLPLFPAPRQRDQAVGRDTLAHFLRKAERKAGMPRLRQDSFHGLRRKWSIERKHLPDADVAKAGGWRSVATMKRNYQLADEAGVLVAVLEPRRLRAKYTAPRPDSG